MWLWYHALARSTKATYSATSELRSAPRSGKLRTMGDVATAFEQGKAAAIDACVQHGVASGIDDPELLAALRIVLLEAAPALRASTPRPAAH
jgi:hypothetical protein